MPLDYDLEPKLKALAPVRAAFLSWFNTIISNALYPEANHAVKAPDEFVQWLDSIGQENKIDEQTLDGVKTAHDNLRKAADDYAAVPGGDLFNAFTDLFENFLKQLSELERGCFLEDMGFDPFTGLRNESVLISDLKKELERFSRQGKPFAIGLVQIDEFQTIKKSLGAEEAKKAVHLVAGYIKKSLRSFDDAYVYGEGEFILSLKQSEVSGASAVLERLRDDLEQNDVVFEFGGKKGPLTLSCCVAEPMPEDEVEQLLENLEHDIKAADKDPGTVLHHYEMSPLERFVQTSDE